MDVREHEHGLDVVALDFQLLFDVELTDGDVLFEGGGEGCDVEVVGEAQGREVEGVEIRGGEEEVDEGLGHVLVVTLLFQGEQIHGGRFVDLGGFEEV